MKLRHVRVWMVGGASTYLGVEGNMKMRPCSINTVKQSEGLVERRAHVLLSLKGIMQKAISDKASACLSCSKKS